MRFLLIDGQGRSAFVSSEKVSVIKDAFTPPLGLLYIGKALEDEGHTVEILQYFTEGKPEEQLKKSLSSVDSVGICVSTHLYKEVAQIVKNIKETDKSIPIIIGGPHCTFHPKESLKHIPLADICLEGEGDLSIKEVAKGLEGTKKLSEIPGIYYRDHNTIKPGKPPEVIKDLDSIPFPARHLVDKYDYGKINNSYFFKPILTSMVTSRGCPFHCRFCSRLALSYNTFRQRSAENVVREIVEINEKYRSVYIVDDNFLADKKRAHKIMDALIKTKTDIDLLVSGARVDSANCDLYKKMKKAGVKYLEFGIESGNQEALDFYNKKITLDQIRKAVKLGRKMNFVIAGNFILGAPLEIKRHIEQTIQFACSIPLDIVLFRPLMYTYGSDLWNKAVQDGNINETDGYSIVADSNKNLSSFTSDELVNMCHNATKRFYRRPSYIARQIGRSIMRRNFSVVKAGWGTL